MSWFMNNDLKIIFIEDDRKKIADVKEFLLDNYNYKDLIVKESYQTGLRELMTANYDLLLLDMSIPMWENSSNFSESFQKFGGYLILNEISRKKKGIKTILITMFDSFGEISLDQLDKHLKEDYPEFYQGYVFYASNSSNWKEELKSKLET